MASKYYKFKGTLYWPQNITMVDEFPPGTRRYKVNIALDDKSKELWEESGIQTKLHEDKQGNVYNILKRDEKKLIKGEEVHFGPPILCDTEGKEINEEVGTGSEAEVDVVVFDTRMGKGHRVNKVTITKLVVYERDPEELPDAEPQKPEEAAVFN